MTTLQSDGRIEMRIPNKLKEKYARHALAKYGMKLASWLKMLAHKDFTSPHE